MTEDLVAALIVRLLRELEEEAHLQLPDPLHPDTPLFGPEGLLDSMGLVTLVVALEQALESEHGVSVSLADEHALSQRRSPYRTIGTLAAYAVRAGAAAG